MLFKDLENMIENIKNYTEFASDMVTLKSFKTIEEFVSHPRAPYLCFIYAESFLKGYFEEAEYIIAKDGNAALKYAMEIVKGPFSLGEPAIAKDATLALQYAEKVLQEPVSLLEKIISKNYETVLNYFSYITNQNVLKNEKSTVNNLNLSFEESLKVWENYIENNAKSISHLFNM